MVCSNVTVTQPMVKTSQSDAHSAIAAVNCRGSVNLTGNQMHSKFSVVVTAHSDQVVGDATVIHTK